MFHQHVGPRDPNMRELHHPIPVPFSHLRVKEAFEGVRTWMYPLSIPSLPIFFPISPIKIPGRS